MTEQRVAATKLLAIGALMIAVAALAVPFGGCPPLLRYDDTGGCCMPGPTGDCGLVHLVSACTALAATAAAVAVSLWLRRRLTRVTRER